MDGPFENHVAFRSDRCRRICGDAEAVTFAVCELWDDFAIDHLLRIDGIEKADVDFYRLSVERGERSLMAVYLGGKRVASIVWALLDEPQGRVFMIDEMGGESRNGVDLIKATNLAAHQVAKTCGATRIRFVTRRKGLMRRVASSFDEVGYILEKSL